MKPITYLLSACLLAGCATGPIVQTDHDSAADFASYHDYAWKQQPPISNPLLKQRIVDAIDAEMAGKGLRLVPEQDADVVLVGNVSAREEQSIEAFYEGTNWNGWVWRPYEISAGGAMHRVQVHNYRVGTMVLDLFDAKTRRAVWRATAEGTVPGSEEHMNRDAMAAVHAMFAEFPPSGAKAQ